VISNDEEVKTTEMKMLEEELDLKVVEAQVC
jgi:hypothetical protein